MEQVAEQRLTPALLTLKQFAEYLNIGETQARQILKNPECEFRVRLCSRLYANRKLVDKWIDSISGLDYCD